MAVPAKRGNCIWKRRSRRRGGSIRIRYSALLKIPAPVFIVFYNGAEDMEERTELRLSQAYEHFEGEQEGLKRGLAQGIVETGCAYGVSKKEILERLQERLNISCQAAQEYFARYSGKKIS